MSRTNLKPTWYDYQLQFYCDFPWHFAHEVPISAKNRNSHAFAVLPIFSSHTLLFCPRMAMFVHVFTFTRLLKTYLYAPHHYFIRGSGNTRDGISKGSPEMFGIFVPSSEKKFVAPNDSLPKFPPRECLANLRKTCEGLYCWPLGEDRVGSYQQQDLSGSQILILS